MKNFLLNYLFIYFGRTFAIAFKCELFKIPSISVIFKNETFLECLMNI